MTPLVWLGLLGASAYVYKKKPQWIPAPLRPKSAKKDVALHQVVATSQPTPSIALTPDGPPVLHGLDEGMTSSQVAAANGLLASAITPEPVYAMASDYSGLGFLKTSEALIAKADALAEAKKHGAEDHELQQQMNTAAQIGQWEQHFGKK